MINKSGLKKRRSYEDHEEAFVSRAVRRGDCLVWSGAKCPKGYGFLAVNGRSVRVHRYAWERVNGAIPEGLEIDHTCWNRSCVNVDHLRLATRSENCSNRPGPGPGNTSGFRNVYKCDGKWRVMIRRGRESYSRRGFDTPEAAAAHAEEMRKQLFGEYAGNG